MRRIDRAATDFNSFASNSGEKGGKMLPQPGVFHFLWEICSGAADEGSAVRTFGRLTNYDARISEAALCVHHNSIDYSLRVLTSLVEPFEARVGAEYMVLGEMETTTGNVPVIQARLLIDADGVDLPLLERAVQEQRKYFQQRDISALETEIADRRDV
ncbi:CST complex subunit TEN1 isoform X2 [Pristis pectinata]|uniref:CST complex subunit TEN1 isoform X2 n=1 Tax=Pristis pectinata TaxID=685728 RepID=UPI00223DFEE1|nr:CST complex subunit TEN1 isoform X2 [Pristis pectinata]